MEYFKVGDLMRKDAKRIKDISGMTQILIDIKPRRSLGELYIDQQMDVTKLEINKIVEQVLIMLSIF